MNAALHRIWRLTLRRLGSAGVVALALLVPSAVIAWWVPRLSRDTDDLRATLAIRAEAAARPATPTRRALSNADLLQEFGSRFPPLTQSASDLERVFALAKQRNVELLKGEYQLKSEANTSLVSYIATFPVHNEYGALKAFAADVLESMPHVSMDELRMSRNDSGSGALDSVVRFTFVYGSP
jgi:hypothetical protein